MTPKEHFDRARDLHDAGDHDAAWAELVTANAIVRGTKDTRTASMASTNFHHAMKANYSAAFLAKAPRGTSILRPIFIVGMPRCGSTITEQILDTHPDVQGLSETAAFVWAERATPFLQIAAKGAAVAERMYLAGISETGWDGKSRWVDKFLGNYSRIGLIHLCFPEATILHIVRDPLDTCFSEFRSIFTTGHDYMYDHGEIGREYVRYRQLMDHWREALPGRVIDVSFEALVKSPDVEIPTLLELCGLPWHEACLHPERNERDAKTASKEQVKQPLNTQGIGVWRPYAKHLASLIESLGPYARAEPPERLSQSTANRD